MRTKLVLLIGVTLLALVSGGVGVAAAQPDAPAPGAPGRRGARTYGVLEAVEGTSLVLATPAGPVTVITNANTVFRIPEAEAPGLDDLTAGDRVVAGGWWGEASTFHAFVVARVRSDRPFLLTGRLTDIGKDALTLETPRGSATVQVSDGTEVHIPDVEQAGLDDLKVGMDLLVRGTLNAEGALQAQVIAVPRVGPRQGRVHGRLLAVEGDKLILRLARGRRISVLTDEETEFHVPGVENPSIADLQVGDKIAGEGVIDETGIRATLVIVLPEQIARLRGEVSGIQGATLTIETSGEPVDVLAGGDAVFRIPGVEDPTLDDVVIGDHVTLAGTWEDEMTFEATIVVVRPGRRPGARGLARGRVIDVGTESLIVGTLNGPLTVRVDDATRYRVPGVEGAGLEDVEPGDASVVRGTWNEDGTLQAIALAVLRRD